MKLRVLFKQHRNKSFNYKPRYYNERKERLDSLKRQYNKVSDVDYVPKRRTSFREDWKTQRKDLNDKNSRVRLIVILVFLLMAAYVVLRFFNFEKLLNG
ncbi:hypothetical protein NBRC110019_13480 [Neptunitalea chrysea]|uniref:Uncharacterized protein n=1 Tax=Neptunitalea chrysea TaxID=1647581 RepID=A0A9W6EU90_9FLAO|nr:hypothetical protein [Neptunitalea chrysea]GLB52309.1 hypothetical protein NBRC110019_13480 [Neptunitalea chrysea]